MTQVQNGVDLSKLSAGAHGPALPPSKRKGPSTKSGVLQTALDKEAAKKAAIGKAVKGQKVKTLAEEKAEANAAVEALEAEAVKPDEVQEVSEPAKPEVAPVTDEELKAALELIKRMTGHQAEAVRKAAAEQKKIAPKGEKVKKVKELTEAQKKKLAELAEKAEAYEIESASARSYVGKGLAESKKMAIALNMLKLPALRWLAKQYEGVEIPKDKRAKLDIAEFLLVALLTWKAPVKA